MKFCSVFFLLHSYLLIFCIPAAKPVIILVHGSFACNESWWQAHGSFYQELAKQAASVQEKLITHSWLGIPTDVHIIEAGKDLARIIIDLPPSEPVVLIGHSHGGNIINVASKILYDPKVVSAPPKPSSLLAEILHECATNSSLLKEKLVNDQLTQAIDEPRIEIMQLKNAQISSGSIKNLVSKKEILKAKEFQIDSVYLLGTPVDQINFAPCMHTIRHLYNFYSSGDQVQTVFGLFGRTYAHHERIANIHVTIDNKQPSHQELHHDLIARWILDIPKSLKDKNLGDFPASAYTNAGVKFVTNGIPQCYKC
jgi:hypothetical protein